MMSWLFITLFLFVACNSVVRGNNTTVSASEMYALQAIYNATNGAYWEGCYGNPWDFTADANPCEDNWIGVTCGAKEIDAPYYILALSLNSCNLVGTIPDAIYLLPNLTSLEMPNNNLYGSIPYTVGDLQYLESLQLEHNHLTGTLPVELSTLPALSALYVGYNELTGQIDLAFNPAIQQSLFSISMSHNGFTGTLPEVLFAYPNAVQIILGTNCFHGTLPESMCNARRINQFEFTCLSCGESCVTHLAEQSNFIVHNPVHGTIPTCIFDLPHLGALYMAQNYFSGSLPSDLVVNSTQLGIVDLSYNRLTGDIPEALQNIISKAHGDGYNSLDVSNNLFTGGLQSAADPNSHSSIISSYNRLSGPAIGGSWDTNPHIDILTGNLFSCTVTKSDLPKGDNAYSRYNCASDNVNNPLIAWLAVLSALAVTAWVAWRRGLAADLHEDWLHEDVMLLQGWIVTADAGSGKVKHRALTQVWQTGRLLRKGAVFSAVAALIVLAPTYVALSELYGTYRHQYAWVLSAVLLSGRIPFALCFAGFLLVLSASIAVLFYFLRRERTLEEIGPADILVKNNKLRIVGYCILYCLVNFVVVWLVNVSFVATSIYASPAYQVGISAFKVVWNLIVTPYLSRRLAHELHSARADYFSLELFVSLMNNIGIPLLAVLFTSPQCVYNLIGGEITSVSGGLVTLPNYNMPFYYSYQCSYVFLDYYAAAYVYMCLMATFGTPMIELCVLYLHKRAVAGTTWFRVVDTVLPRILKPVDTNQAPVRDILKPYFDATQYLVTQITYLALMLTMGVVFPPIALVLLLAMASTTVCLSVKVGRLLASAEEFGNIKYAELIEQECSYVATISTMRRAFWMLLWFGCCFYALFLFDTLGDAVGFKSAYWVIIAVPLLPVVPTVLSFFTPEYRRREEREAKESTRQHNLDVQISPLNSFVGVDDELGLRGGEF